MKIDLHVHSKHSTRPSQWILQKMGCPESFVEPRQIYRLAKARGMDRVTITDHNAIGGALEIAHLPGTFISEEVTTFFPEDGCKLHVLVWDIDERQHDDIQAIRRNLYELLAYLRANSIRHGAAHPLYAVNDKLTAEHVEKMLLLFRCFEVNGTRDDMQNNALRAILDLLTPEIMDSLAERHRLDPPFDEPWRKSLFGGSDDHSGLNISRIHTGVEDAADLEAFFQGLIQGRSRPLGLASSPKTMAHNLYAIAYQFFKDRYGLKRYAARDRFLRYLDTALSPEPAPAGGPWSLLLGLLNRLGLFRSGDPESFLPVVRAKAEAVFLADPALRRTANHGQPPQGEAEEEWHDFVRRAGDRTLSHYADTLLDELSSGNLVSLFQGLGAAGALHTLLSPYLVAYGVFTRDRAFCREALARFTRRSDDTAQARPPKLLHFTDTFRETNGVALTIQEHLLMARRTGKDYTVATCLPGNGPGLPGAVNFTPVGVHALPEYSDLSLCYPPLLDILDYAYRNEFTHIHVATPGPVGLAGLLTAKLLRLPVHGTYHTAFPQYCRLLTGDETMEEAAWRYMVWFHSLLDAVFTPSAAMARELTDKGVPARKIATYPRGVDTDRFTPAKRNGFYARYGLNGRTKLLYVGRVSKEKNMPVLETAFKELQRIRPDVDLVVVGDGPYRAEMERNLQGWNCLFTGVLEGEALDAAYASSDLFVFPSTTDTFGRVVLEAQASGLPVIVTDAGGPQENMLPMETGLVVAGGDEQSLTRAMADLAADPERIRRMGRRARLAMESRSPEQAFERVWELYTAP